MGLNEDKTKTQYEGRYFGLYFGYVTDRDDPQKRFRIKLSCPKIYGFDEKNKPIESGWAWPRPGASGNKSGFFSLPKAGDLVYVEFVEGDTNYPIWSPGPWTAKLKLNNEDERDDTIPDHAREVAESDDLIGKDGIGNRPPSMYKGKYGEVQGIRTPGGHILELDDTEGQERVQLYHKSGSHVEIGPDGDIYIQSMAGAKIFAAGKASIKFGGATEVEMKTLKQKIKGKTEVTIEGDKITSVNGKEQSISGAFERLIKGDFGETIDGNKNVSIDGSKIETIGGNLIQSVTHAEAKTILETAEFLVANALCKDPTTTALLWKAFNGKASYHATDPTGKVLGAMLDLSPMPTPMATLFAGVPISGIGSKLTLDGTGITTRLDSLLNLALSAKAMITIDTAGLIHIGAPAGLEPILKGISTLAAIDATLVTIAAQFAAHVHVGNLGLPSSPPVTPMVPPPLSPLLSAIGNLRVLIAPA